MDRFAIATERRRRLALERLEDERRRESALVERLESLVEELEGSAIDERVLAELSPTDAELVRAALGLGEEDLGVEGFFDALAGFELDLEPEPEPSDPVAETEAELARLQAEISSSRTVQAALSAYVDALAELDP